MSARTAVTWRMTPAIRNNISQALWRCDEVPSEAYYIYYAEQCRIASRASGGKIPSSGHEDILSIAADLHLGLQRSAILENLQNRRPSLGSDDVYEAAVDLAARVMLMIDVGEMRNVFSGRKKLFWMDGPVSGFIQELFDPKPRYDHDGIRLNVVFTARNLDRIAGFKVELTANLADHLRLHDGDKTVSLFHFASFLRCQQNNTLFPNGFISETLKTLALLFPPRDVESQKWLRKRGDPEDIDLTALNCGPVVRQIEEYRYWHDRLVILKEAFDETQPETFTQWWTDRRDGVQWYTLWVAVALTVFFGLIQSIEGALQVYKAFHAA